MANDLIQLLTDGSMKALAVVLKQKTAIEKFQDHGVICEILRGVLKAHLPAYLRDEVPQLLGSGLSEAWIKQAMTATCLEWAIEAWGKYQVWKGDQTLFDGAPRMKVDTAAVRLEARQDHLF